ncbi:leucine carboxyl methyltransferase family protein [Mycobacterium xenopi 3993]|nr:leucine carboxyl methyltransferase family protein [Mycobacterium xenopi 3993]
MTAPNEKKWTRSDNDQWDILSSVGYTALLVAGWRAVHALSAEPLARDDYAQHFISASADPYLTGLLANPATSEDATAFPRLYGVQTRFFDDFFLSAAGHGIRQAVIVAAALIRAPIGLPGPRARRCSKSTSRKYSSSRSASWASRVPSPARGGSASQPICVTTGQSRCR